VLFAYVLTIQCDKTNNNNVEFEQKSRWVLILMHSLLHLYFVWHWNDLFTTSSTSSSTIVKWSVISSVQRLEELSWVNNFKSYVGSGFDMFIHAVMVKRLALKGSTSLFQQQ